MNPDEQTLYAAFADCLVHLQTSAYGKGGDVQDVFSRVPSSSATLQAHHGAHHATISTTTTTDAAHAFSYSGDTASDPACAPTADPQAEARARARQSHLRAFRSVTMTTAPTAAPAPPANTSSLALCASYAQTVKETALCFMALHCQDALSYDTSAATTESAALAAANRVAATSSTTAGLTAARVTRQSAIVSATQQLLTAVVAQEHAMQCALAPVQAAAAGSTLTTPQYHSSPRASPSAAHNPTLSVAAALHAVPLMKWVGFNRFAAFLTVVSPTIPHVVPAAGASRQPLPSLPPAPPPPTVELRAASGLGGQAAARTCQVPRDVAAEVAVYVQLREEAAARARLRALRSEDAEAFAEHVSLLKITTLLRIMETTHAFMTRIGLLLRSRADGVQGGAAHVEPRGPAQAPSPPVPPPAGHSAQASSEYQRFKAYVASTRDDFRLVHRVDVFVEHQPVGLCATLLPHQMDGLRFLASLHANHINGILADEMGVGKTIQTLAFLLHLKEGTAVTRTTAERRPHLVLAPLSVVREWRAACEQFVPEAMRVAVFQTLMDPVREAPMYDIVLLPIHAVRSGRVAEAAARIPWGYLVVDEAHKAVANLHTQTARAILRLPYERRLVLTGTPLSSDLQELWSLLYFLNPDVFTDADSFDEVFRRPFARYEAAEMELSDEERGLLVLRLHQILRPFMLRRVKRDVDRGLRMTLHTLRCPLTYMQTRLLTLLREARRTPCAGGAEMEDESNVSTSASASVCDSDAPSRPTALDGCGDTASAAGVASRTPASTRGYRLTTAGVSQSTAQLLCNHAFLLPFLSQVLHRNGLSESAPPTSPDSAADAVLACSGKLLMLHLLLARLHLAGRKGVLFTHWLDCVELVAEYLDGRGWRGQYEVLTGDTDEDARQSRVDRFRTDTTCHFMLLSIRAGGCGINLQAAHVVILLDRDYTLTNEDQALARVYRIGQSHTVRAVYLMTDDSAERRVAARAVGKNRPRLALIEGGVYHVRATDGRDVEVMESTPHARVDRTDDDDDEKGSRPTPGEESCGKADAVADVNAELTGQLCDDMAALWEQEVMSHDGRTGRPTPGCVSDAAWAALHRTVCCLDALVLTESDGPGSHAHTLLSESRPPPSATEAVEWTQPLTDAATAPDTPDPPVTVVNDLKMEGEGEEEAEVAAARSRLRAQGRQWAVAFWPAFWKLWREAQAGPPLLRAALDAAIANDAKWADPVYQRRRRERRARAQTRRLASLVADAPPEWWQMGCWERGVEDDEEIARLYDAHVCAQREAAEARRAERAAAAAAAARIHAQPQSTPGRRAKGKRAAATEPTPSPAGPDVVQRARPHKKARTGGPSTPHDLAVHAADPRASTGATPPPAAEGSPEGCDSCAGAGDMCSRAVSLYTSGGA